MTDSNWRVGDFYFPVGQEPERYDFVPSKANPLYSEMMPHGPFLNIGERGKGMSRVSIQGLISGFTGATGLEALEGACSFDGNERVLQVQAHDGTIRRFYTCYGEIKSDIIGTRKNFYGYNANFLCYNPFKYDNTLSNTSAISVGTSDTDIDLGNNIRGTTDSWPIFIIQNTSGGSLSSYQMTISDGASTITGNHIISPSYTLPNNSELVLCPYKWDNNEWRSLVWTAFYRPNITAPTTDAYELYNVSDFITAGVTMATWPRIMTASPNFTAKGSASGAKLVVQWRKAYG